MNNTYQPIPPNIQEYYANTGALRKAAQNARGAAVGCSVVEATRAEAQPRELEEVLRLEYRSKLLNPKYGRVGHNVENCMTASNCVHVHAGCAPRHHAIMPPRHHATATGGQLPWRRRDQAARLKFPSA